MRKIIVPFTIALAVLAAGCGKKEPARPASSASEAPAGKASNPYATPTLTDDKVVKFIASMKEEKNPLEFIFKPGGGMRNMAQMKAKEVEFNAYAAKYGFKDLNEYLDTWGRIMVGQMQIGAAEMMKGLAESTQQSIDNAQKELAKPGLSAEMKQMYTDQVESGKKSLADINKPADSSLNEADLALVRKYGPQIEAASKKHR